MIFLHLMANFLAWKTLFWLEKHLEFIFPLIFVQIRRGGFIQSIIHAATQFPLDHSLTLQQIEELLEGSNCHCSSASSTASNLHLHSTGLIFSIPYLLFHFSFKFLNYFGEFWFRRLSNLFVIHLIHVIYFYRFVKLSF